MPAKMDPSKKLSYYIPVRVPAKTASKLKNKAKKAKISMAEYVREILQQHLEKMEWK